MARGRPRNPECSDCGKPLPKTERARKGWKGGRCPPCSRSYHTAAVRRHRARKSERERERERVLAEARELGKMDPSDWGPMVNMNVHDTVAKGLPITATQAEQMREYGIGAGEERPRGDDLVAAIEAIVRRTTCATLVVGAVP